MMRGESIIFLPHGILLHGLTFSERWEVSVRGQMSANEDPETMA